MSFLGQHSNNLLHKISVEIVSFAGNSSNNYNSSEFCKVVILLGLCTYQNFNHDLLFLLNLLISKCKEICLRNWNEKRRKVYSEFEIFGNEKLTNKNISEVFSYLYFFIIFLNFFFSFSDFLPFFHFSIFSFPLAQFSRQIICRFTCKRQFENGILLKFTVICYY